LSVGPFEESAGSPAFTVSTEPPHATNKNKEAAANVVARRKSPVVIMRGRKHGACLA
jgi:hypothetical protein